MAAMTGPKPLLTVENLALERGGRQLFGNLAFTVAPGGLVLLRGPNGAGKSSLLLTLTGVLRPSAGTLDWHADEPPKLHLLGHQPGVKSRLTLGENLNFWRAVNGPTGIEPQAALDQVGLGDLAGLDAGYLSAGQTKRHTHTQKQNTTHTHKHHNKPHATHKTNSDILV